MTHNQSNQKNKIWDSIIIFFSIIGLIACIALLFPQVRRMILDFIIQILNLGLFSYDNNYKFLLYLASGGICFILFFNYCTLTKSGRSLVQEVKKEIRDCWSEIDYKSFIKPVLLMLAIYSFGILTIIRANNLYRDDIVYSIIGSREWHNWSRYINVFLSYFVQPEINITDISPIPQLLAVFILSCSSVLLVFILSKGKITTLRLLASIPLGLSPYFLECLSYKFMAHFFAFSVLTCLVPFLFIARKKAFFFVSVVFLVIMCMTYQAASGIYILITIILCFQYWNSREKTNKEILNFLGIAAIAYCFSMLLFRFFLMRPVEFEGFDHSTEMLSITQFIPGILNNIKDYAFFIYHDFGMIWKIGIVITVLFFILKSIYSTVQRKILSLFVSIILIGLSFILSFGVYLLLAKPAFNPRAMFGFGVFLAIMCVYAISDYKKVAAFFVIALNWCFFVFAFSYGNAIADQARYEEFRIGILLNDLSTLYLDQNKNVMYIHLKNTIEFAPTVKNIAKHNPVIEQLVYKRLEETHSPLNCNYFLDHFNYNSNMKYIGSTENDDFNTSNLPVVLDSYYHTIKSDGEHILVILKH